MNKRGSHADWAISMGIFLVYILVLFIIIRPGVKPVHDEEVLLDLIEENFNKEVKWIVKMTPLFVRDCGPDEKGDPTSITIEDKSGYWEFTHYTFVDANGNEVSVPEIYCIGGHSKPTLTCGGSGEEGQICNSVDDKIFRIYYKQRGSKYIEENLPELDIDLGEGNQAELGSSENIEGINFNWLGYLQRKGDLEGGYEEIKLNDWKFPESRDFSITVDGEKIIGGTPYEQTNIFVREWTDWKVDQNGKKRNIRVSIKVW